METEITNRVGAGWSNWKKCTGVLSISVWAEPCGEMKRQEKRIEVNEMRMLWWIGCRLQSDTQIQDEERTRAMYSESGAGFQKDHDRRLKWYGRVMSLMRDRDEEHILGKVLPY